MANSRRTRLYPTLKEAAEAAQALEITTGTEYKTRYFEDPRLPSGPDTRYAEMWKGWPVFLGQDDRIKDFYPTLKEAAEAAQALGITTSSEYKTRYFEDPRLPSSPNSRYAQTWEGWPVFLGQKDRIKDFYPTLKEAAEAAQALGITTSSEYNTRYSEDPRLPSSPNSRYAEMWEGWPVFLGQKDRIKDFYPTLKEAAEATQALGITTSSEYNTRYSEDPRLPSGPDTRYAEMWKGWPVFLGQDDRIKDFYLTLKEAAEAAQALGITTGAEYKTRYFEDPRLPSSPDIRYAQTWEGWPVFLGQKDRIKDFYPTLKEAAEAAQALGITTGAEYKTRYFEDPRLPSGPDSRYAEVWAGWPVFLGQDDRTKDFYPTLKEAAEAAQALGITTGPEYFIRYSEDPRLPYSPDRHYAEVWESWRIFLGTDRTSEPLGGAFSAFSETCPEWKSAVERYIEINRSQETKITHLRPFLNEIVIPSGCADWPGTLLHKDTVFPKAVFEAYVYATGETQRKVRYNTCLYLLDWILDEYCSDENDNGELERLPGYRNPIAIVMRHLAEQFQSYRPSESQKPVLPMSVIDRARKNLIPERCKTFSDLSRLHESFMNTWFEVERSLIDPNDPDCVWRETTKDRKRKGKRYKEAVFEIWSPVKLVALYTLLRVPLRGQQILWLDSGEADTEIPVINRDNIEWIENRKPLRNYQRAQSFIKKYPDDSAGMFVTTNKTGGKSYSVPYMPTDLAYWIIRLRDWQSKYNPLTKPTPWTKIDLRQKINKDVLRSRGSQTFLFRDPCSSKENRYSPMHTTTAFSRSLPALLFAIQRPGEDLADLVSDGPRATLYKSKFTAHSLRTSLITALMVEGGASAEILMKLVGHATIVMTMYYARIGPNVMHKELGDAEKRALESEVDRFKDLAFARKIEEAKSGLIATDGDLLDRLDASWPSAAYQFMDIGFCTMSGQGCDKGGAALVERKSETIYAPVETGYLGKRNCPRCRFFVTGPAWIGGLQSLANQVLVEVNAVKTEYHELLEEQQKLEDERFDTERDGKHFNNMKVLNQTTAAMEERGQKLDVLLTDFQHVYRLMRQCIALLHEEDDGASGQTKQQLVVSGNGFMQMSLEESDSGFRLLANVCKDAEIYQSASASRATPKLAQMIDRFAEINGFSPGIFRLTEKQQLKAVNQIANLLLKRFNSDWVVTEKIVQGELTLADLSSEEALVPLKSEIAHALRGEANSLESLGGLNVIA